MPTGLLAKAREKGLEESLGLGRDALHATLQRFSINGDSASIFISPQMGNSGAPHILMDVVEEFAERPGSVRLLCPAISPELRERADACGAGVERAAAVLNPTFVRLQLALRKRDFVLLNTVAVERNYLEFILTALEGGRLAHAYWYIHEDTDQLPALAPFLLEPDFQARIGRLSEQSLLTLLAPSRNVKAQYNALFNTHRTRLLPYKVTVDPIYTLRRPVGDYSTVNFLLSGKPTDGRKGHMIALAAFHEFMKSSYERNPDAYRPFTLTLIGITDDRIGEQIRVIGSSTLGERLRVVPSVSRARALDITRTCNAVVCCSFNEALPVYVIEAMAMGHVVLRNDSAGMEEQLEEGVNGFRLDSRDIQQMARVLETVLSRQAMPNGRLQAMGRASQERVASIQGASYVEALER